MRSPRRNPLRTLAVYVVLAAALASPVITSGPMAGPGSSAMDLGPLARVAALTATTTNVEAASAPMTLRWRPPLLSHPITIRMTSATGELRLRSGQDYRVILPRDGSTILTHGLVVMGGRSVVVVGGTVDVGDGYQNGGATVRRGIYLKGQTGTVFVEGVALTSSTRGSLTEGIDLDQRLGATVVLQNIRMSRLVGSYGTNHADGIQTWAGPKRLLVDGLFMRTTYQGLFLLPNQAFSGPRPVRFDLRHVTIIGEPGSAYLVWRDQQAYPFRVSKFFVAPSTRALDARTQFIWDRAGTLQGVQASRTVPNYASTAGDLYRSPGYL